MMKFNTNKCTTQRRMKGGIRLAMRVGSDARFIPLTKFEEYLGNVHTDRPGKYIKAQLFNCVSEVYAAGKFSKTYKVNQECLEYYAAVLDNKFDGTFTEYKDEISLGRASAARAAILEQGEYPTIDINKRTENAPEDSTISKTLH